MNRKGEINQVSLNLADWETGMSLARTVRFIGTFAKTYIIPIRYFGLEPPYQSNQKSHNTQKIIFA
jgi:hypothetical protein